MMRYTTPESLAEEIGAALGFVQTTIGLDEGCLAKSPTTLYFLAQRMGGWEVVEETPLTDVVRVDKQINFMGEITVLICKSGRWQCRNVPESVDIAVWLGSSVTLDATDTKAMKASLHTEMDSPKESKIIETETYVEPEKNIEVGYDQATQDYYEELAKEAAARTQDQPPQAAEEVIDDLDTSDDEEGSSCLGTVVKWIVYIWIFSFIFDMCE